ncbi:NAD(P) transhydrogenase subunit alpha [Williamsia sp.]|uniref:NAD(P) transhydrogenase subunit alpha n=1 Tax=Williamsia sp. TaxID=1872085 RepID=UPI001A2B7B44|nr:NAD(P) transhydrogenase subunit alpha [Williamsia sp.]MBJ7287923.1 NAD(P) transhydrogenase subunit alpha [Williamsia sp.]
MVSTLWVGAVRERVPGEKRVSVTPSSVNRLQRSGVSVMVETGAGAGAWVGDAEYIAAGARISTLDDVIGTADIITCVHPSLDVVAQMHAGQYLAGMLDTRTNDELVRTITANSVVGLDLSLLPRTLSSAQSMDAMTSQDSAAGYKAAVLAAHIFGQYFPMMITAAGTFRPARLLVLGAGVAGLQAIGTSRRLGADVTGYDVRPETRGEIESLGARFLELPTMVPTGGADGYAGALTPEQRTTQQAELQSAVSAFDVVITTARVPGRRPPVLVTAQALEAMHSGSVVIDMGASDLGGNVVGSVENKTVVMPTGVSVIGAGQLASTIPAASSAAFARNIADLIAHMVRDGEVTVDPDDQIAAAIIVGATASTNEELLKVGT